jgi:excisionase family DNA binding protein
VTNIIDATALADRLCVCRRTVLTNAAKAGAIEKMGNKYFVRADMLKRALGDRYDCLAPDAIDNKGIPVRGKHLTFQEAANILGCSRSTILRVAERTGLGVQIGRRRYIPEWQLQYVKKKILSRGVTTLHSDKKAMSENGRRLAAARWG